MYRLFYILIVSRLVLISEFLVTAEFKTIFSLLYFFIKGEIFVRPGAKLDREELSDIDIQVTASDSPLDAVVRRYSTVTVRLSYNKLWNVI